MGHRVAGCPPAGLRRGGLEWRIVGPTLYRSLTEFDIPVELFAPFGTPHEELRVDFLAGSSRERKLPATRVPATAVAVVAILDQVSSQRHHYPIGRVSMQKIAYFATQSGIPTGLQFERRPYGPFAPTLKPMMSKLRNNGLLDERRRDRMFEARPGPTFDDAQTAFKDELAGWTHEIDRVADLFLRIPSTRKAEITASTHYVAASLADRCRVDDGEVSEKQVVDGVAQWKSGRDNPPTREEITTALRTLDYLGWVDVRTEDAMDELAVLA